MPGAKRMHQESENSGKPEYIFGHMFGVIGVLVGSAEKLFCVPLFRKYTGWRQHHTKMGEQRVQSCQSCCANDQRRVFCDTRDGQFHIVVGRVFFTTVGSEGMAGTGKQSPSGNCNEAVVAYTEPSAYKGRGRPRKKGDAIKVKELFDVERENFKEMKIVLYGKEKSVRCLSKDLL
ncbi:hypothetical protein FACS1894187_13170 [Synergistales bacterium]|nr:hypothetical protein FACS1894187_13170 [Synergistales bacterium]